MYLKQLRNIGWCSCGVWGANLVVQSAEIWHHLLDRTREMSSGITFLGIGSIFLWIQWVAALGYPCGPHPQQGASSARPWPWSDPSKLGWGSFTSCWVPPEPPACSFHEEWMSPHLFLSLHGRNVVVLMLSWLKTRVFLLHQRGELWPVRRLGLHCTEIS